MIDCEALWNVVTSDSNLQITNKLLVKIREISLLYGNPKWDSRITQNSLHFDEERLQCFGRINRRHIVFTKP